MFCANCGQRLEDGMLFCPNCGTKIQWIEEDIAKDIKADAEADGSQGDGFQVVEAEKDNSEPSEQPAEEAGENMTEQPTEEAGENLAEQPAGEAGENLTEESREQNGKKKRGGVGILTFFLCLLMFFGCLAAALSGALRLSYTENQVISMMNRFDAAKITIPSGSKGEEISVVDFLEKASDFNFEKTAGVKKKDLEKLLSKSYVSELAAKYVVEYVNYFFTGKEPESFTRDDVVDFVREHDDDFCELMKFRFTYVNPATKQREVYTVDIDNAFKDLGTDEITVEWIQEASGINLSLIRTILSVPVLVGAGVICFLLLLIVILIQPKKHKGIFADGMTLFLAGFVMDMAVEAGIFLWGAKKSSIVYFALSPLFHNLLIIGSTVLVIGLVMILLASKIGSADRKKQKAVSNEVQETEQA